MDIGKLYETLTGEPCPHAPKAVVEAAWALSKDARPAASTPAQADLRSTIRAPGRPEGPHSA